MQEQTLKKQNNPQDSRRQHTRSLSDRSILKSNSLVQQRLKKSINNKFNRETRHHEMQIIIANQRRNTISSLFANNPLVKSSFLISDAITHKSAMKTISQPKKLEKKSSLSSIKKVNSSYREHHSYSFDNQFFQTGAENASKFEAPPKLKQIFSAREIISIKSTHDPTITQKMRERNNKFKLLFRQKNSQYKTVSERKMARIDSKIQALRDKSVHLKSLIPKQNAKPMAIKPKPRGQIVKKQKIMALALNLIKYIQLYFNMYQQNNIVGNYLKTVEGYNKKVKDVLMIDTTRAKRIREVQEITNKFWAFKDQNVKPEYFGEDDLALYNTLNGYSLKMQKKYVQNLNRFSYFQSKKRAQEKQLIEKVREKYEKQGGRHQQINKINYFIEHRVRYDQKERQGNMNELQKRGVKLNFIERSRELILREKEQAMKQAIKGKSAQLLK